MLLILLLLGLMLLFAYHLFLTLFLILFSAFVSHCVTPFHSLFTVLPLPPVSQGQYILGIQAYTRSSKRSTRKPADISRNLSTPYFAP